MLIYFLEITEYPQDCEKERLFRFKYIYFMVIATINMHFY